MKIILVILPLPDSLASDHNSKAICEVMGSLLNFSVPSSFICKMRLIVIFTLQCCVGIKYEAHGTDM